MEKLAHFDTLHLQCICKEKYGSIHEATLASCIAYWSCEKAALTLNLGLAASAADSNCIFTLAVHEPPVLASCIEIYNFFYKLSVWWESKKKNNTDERASRKNRNRLTRYSRYIAEPVRTAGLFCLLTPILRRVRNLSVTSHAREVFVPASPPGDFMTKLLCRSLRFVPIRRPWCVARYSEICRRLPTSKLAWSNLSSQHSRNCQPDR